MRCLFRSLARPCSNYAVKPERFGLSGDLCLIEGHLLALTPHAAAAAAP